MPVFTVVGLARAPGLKLEGEETEEDEEGFLCSTNFEIPKSLEMSENQSLRNLMRKSVFTFSPFVSALLVADENRSFILKVSLFFDDRHYCGFELKKGRVFCCPCKRTHFLNFLNELFHTIN